MLSRFCLRPSLVCGELSWYRCRGPAGLVLWTLPRVSDPNSGGAPVRLSPRPGSLFGPDGLAQAASLKKVQVRARSSQVGSKPAKQRRRAVLAMVTEGWERSVVDSRTRARLKQIEVAAGSPRQKHIRGSAVARIAHTQLSRALIYVVHSLQAKKRCRAPRHEQ